MRILPELESYRDRLMARASAWAETSREDLTRDLDHCLDQVSLLEKGVMRLRARIESMTVGSANGTSEDRVHGGNAVDVGSSPSMGPPSPGARASDNGGLVDLDTWKAKGGTRGGTTPVDAVDDAPGVKPGQTSGFRVQAAADTGSDSPSTEGERSEREVLLHRLSVQEQMRDLTAAYAEALRRRLEASGGPSDPDPSASPARPDPSAGPADPDPSAGPANPD